MKRLTTLTAAIAIFMLAMSTAFAQAKRPDFSGEWRPAPAQKAGMVLSIKQDAMQIVIKDSTSTTLFKLDGSATLYIMNGTLAPANMKPDDAPIKTTAKWNGNRLTLTFDANNGDRPFTIVDVYELSNDGKTLTRDRTTTIADQGPSNATKEKTTYVK